jgi:hypothetical protein
VKSIISVATTAHVAFWHSTELPSLHDHVRLARDFVAERFCASERARLIQDQAPTRNVDSGMPLLRFNCCVSLFYSFSAATFATQSEADRKSFERSEHFR